MNDKSFNSHAVGIIFSIDDPSDLGRTNITVAGTSQILGSIQNLAF